MALIDVDKFVCSLLSKIEKRKDHVKGIGWLEADGKYRFITNLLADQGIIYKDGSLIKIGSKKCEGKLKEMLDEKVLANSCESCKVEEWFMCKHDWKAIDNEIIFEKGMVYHISHPWLGNVINFADYFRPATEEEIKGKDRGISANSGSPKFKVGDVVKHSYYNGLYYVVKSIDLAGDYELECLNGKSGNNIAAATEDRLSLWIIQDAKPGDVLVNQNGEMPFIFKSYNKNHVFCYCAYTNHKDMFFPKFVNDDGTDLHWINLLHEQVSPASKKQAELFFQKMKEAGYVWDIDKHEIKKIESKPEVDIDNMVDEFWNSQDRILSSHTRVLVTEAYTQGIKDTLELIKKG